MKSNTHKSELNLGGQIRKFNMSLRRNVDEDDNCYEEKRYSAEIVGDETVVFKSEHIMICEKVNTMELDDEAGIRVKIIIVQ